jgi:hypothetical protein
MTLLAGGVADADEMLLGYKLLEQLRSDATSSSGGRGSMFLECGGLDCYVFAEDGGGSGRLMGGVVLASDPAWKKLGGLLPPMFFVGLDPDLRVWWLSRLVNTLWLGVSSASTNGPTASAILLRR